MNGHDDEAKQKFKVRIFEKGNLVKFKIKITKINLREQFVSLFKQKIILVYQIFWLG